MIARKSTQPAAYMPDPALASPAADNFAAHCLQQLVVRGQLPQEFASPATSHAAQPPRTHEGPKSAEK